MINAEILADSVNIETGDRLTTFRVRVPKFLVAEISRHRVLSLNFASSRAIPAKKIREQVLKAPFIPIHWGANQKGMQAEAELSGFSLWAAKKAWLWARYPAIAFHWTGERLGLHKQIINRILEPWMWADGILSATEWRNFFKLRTDAAAQPEFKRLADEMRSLYEASTPDRLAQGEWHIPLIQDFDYEGWDLAFAPGDSHFVKISTARCARVSYLFREWEDNWQADYKLHDRLAVSGHWSPFEHQAVALPTSERSGNFVGWKQYRKEFLGESSGDYQAKEEAIA